MRTVKVAAAAEEDLRGIWAYVAEHNAEAASKLIKEITASSLSCATFQIWGGSRTDC